MLRALILPGMRSKAVCWYCIAAFFIIVQSGCMKAHRADDAVFQVSTIQALFEGVYDGDMTFKELKRHGDLGIGTFDALDGEMIGLRGKFYQIKADGKAYPVDDSMKTPFSVVTFFEPDRTIVIKDLKDYKQLQEYLNGLLVSSNVPYAFKIEGVFDYVKTRSVPRQKKPYPRLVEVVKNQPTFEFRNIRGAIVGFRLPQYMEGINVSGYHFHFISEDRTSGGHLLECVLRDVKVEMDSSFNFFMVLPEHGDFYTADLGKKKQGEMEVVEKGASK